MKRYGTEDEASLNNLDERASAFHQSIVFARGAYPNMALATYDNEVHRGAEHLLLVKLITGIGNDPVWLDYLNCDSGSHAENIPGGLACYVKTENDELYSEITPLMIGREDCLWEGGAVIAAKNKSGSDIWFKFGNGNLTFMHFSPNQQVSGPNIDCEEGYAEIEGDSVYIYHKDRCIITCISGLCDFDIHDTDQDNRYGKYALAHFSSKADRYVYLKIGFSKSKERAYQIAHMDAIKEKERIDEYYSTLLSSRYIDTSDKDIDKAFEHAILNLEYAWLNPYGWIESIHHWPTMWHMEQTGSEEWFGFSDRSRACLMSQMKHVFANGAIPDMCVNGAGRRDWGGNNQFFFREVLHYILMTGDKDFASHAELYLLNALRQTFNEYDPTESGIISWATQIGNQEDMESTPGKGSATGSEGVRMLRIMGHIEEILGKHEEAVRYYTLSDACNSVLHNRLWKRDIGRYIWYDDILDAPRLDASYHGILYPIIYGQLDSFDSISSIDHIVKRLSGPEGEVYQSNHFGDHCYMGVPTWGMQAGSDMQCFATSAYARLGMNNEAIKPLKFISSRVNGDYQRGSWPETANEKRYAYFSPSAGLYAQEIIESVFGIKRDMVKNQTSFSPCFPSDWDHAELNLPSLYVSYVKKDGVNTFTVDTKDRTTLCFTWRLKPFYDVKATDMYGNTIPVSIIPNCGWFDLKLDLGNVRNFNISVSYMNLDVVYDKSIACGDVLKMNVSGAVIIGINDRLGVFSEISYKENSIQATVKDDLLKPYIRFGALGIMNFSRRIFSLKLRYGSVDFEYPVYLTVLPKVMLQSSYDDICHKLTVKLNNCSVKKIRRVSIIIHEVVFSHNYPEEYVTFDLSAEIYESLTPGKNLVHVIIYYEDAVINESIYAECRRSTDLTEIEFKKDLLMPVNDWRKIGIRPSHGCLIQNADCFMNDLYEAFEKAKTENDILKLIPFKLNVGGFIPLCVDNTRITGIDLTGIKARKLYILLSAFLQNNDTYSTVFKLELETTVEGAYIKPIYNIYLNCPGDLDSGFGNNVIAGFATYVSSTVRSGLYMPLLPDYTCLPPTYPDRSLWCSNKAIELANTVFNVIEIDLERTRDLKELRIICKSADSVGGIFAISYL